MELTDYRGQLDKIDSDLLKLFAERMDIAAEIAAWKKDNHMPVLDLRREKEKLRTLEEQSPEELKEYTASLFSSWSSPAAARIAFCIRQAPRLRPLSVP